jgi:hypothetical protein
MHPLLGALALPAEKAPSWPGPAGSAAFPPRNRTCSHHHRLAGLAGPAAHLVADVAGEPSIFRFVDD